MRLPPLQPSEHPVSPMWDEPEPASGICSACTQHTENGIAHWIPRASGADVRIVLHANPADCPRPARPLIPGRTGAPPIPVRLGPGPHQRDTSTQEEA